MLLRTLLPLIAIQLLLPAASLPAAPGSEKTTPSYSVTSESLKKRQQEIDGHLSDIYAFWLDPEREDKEFGGLLYYLDESLQPAGPTNKNIMMHLRALFNYAKGIQEGEEKRFPDLRQRLDKHLKYLEKSFSDPHDGLWFYELTREGKPIERDHKLMIAQIYAIYLLSEVHLMTGNEKALASAEETFARVEAAYDSRFGGYRQRIDRGAFAAENLRKSCATNLHMLLALSRLARASPKQVYKDRLMELYELLPRYVDPGSGNAYWSLTFDWQPIPFDEGINNRTMYGHNAELLWYMTEAAPVLERKIDELIPFLRHLGKGLLDHGISNDGAVYFFGPINGPSDDRQVQWWAPVETMIAVARLYRLTGEPIYWEAYCKIADWTFKHFIPPSTPGAWYTVAQPDGTLSDKRRGGFIWKSGFHEIRGLTILREELREIHRAKHAAPSSQQ